MKLYKSLFLVAAIICGVMTSCSEDGFWDKASSESLGLTNGSAYTFNSKSLSYVYYPADVTAGTDINVTVTRSISSDAATIPIAAKISDEELLSGPESVTFEKGSNTAYYAIHFEKEIEIGQSVTVDLVIDTLSVGVPKVEKPTPLTPGATAADSAKFLADSTNYAIYLTKLSNYKLATKVNISKDYNWESLGKGIMTENFWFENGEAPASVTIMQAVENKKIFRVVDPWSIIADAVGVGLNGNQTNLQFRLLEVGEALNDVAITQKDLVYFDQSNTGYHHSSYDADVWLIHPADFTNTGTEDKWLYNKVLSYQENGLPAVVQLAPRYYMFGVGGWNQSQADGILTIVFPGVKVYDYSAEVSYVGMFTDPDGATSVWADLTLGADAKTAKAVIISQDADPAAVADAIAAGELEATDVEAGRIELPLPADANGKLQIVVAVIDGGEAKNVATAKFEYYSGASPWETVGVGYYTDDYIVSYYGEQDEAGNFVPYDPETYQVEIEANTSTPGLYRIKNAYAPLVKLFGEEGGEKDIEVHAEDPAGVYILQQPTGVDFGKGEFDIESYGGYLIAKNSDATPAEVIAYFAGKFGTLTDGVITFPVLEAQDGSTLQGYLYRGGELLYYGGTTGASQIVLPSASAQVKAKAKKAAAATDFVHRLSGKMHFNSTSIMRPKGFKANVAKMKKSFSRELVK